VTIKSHHNVGGLPARMNMNWSSRYANCSRRGPRARPRAGLARCVRRPPSIPGPASRSACPGEITVEKLDILRKAECDLHRRDPPRRLYDTIWQAFAVLLPVKTVGVMGDGRPTISWWACAP